MAEPDFTLPIDGHDDLMREAAATAAGLREAAGTTDAPALHARLRQAAAVIDRLTNAPPEEPQEPESLEERIENQHTRILDAQAIVGTCQRAIDIEEHWDLQRTLGAAYETLHSVAHAVGALAREVQGMEVGGKAYMAHGRKCDARPGT